jgi:hypothetical protein
MKELGWQRMVCHGGYNRRSNCGCLQTFRSLDAPNKDSKGDKAHPTFMLAEDTTRIIANVFARTCVSTSLLAN